MKTVGAFEAKTHLSELLKTVSGGEEIIITKHDMPIARLSPYKHKVKKSDIADIIEKIKKEKKQYGLKEATIKELIEEGRA